MGNKVKSGNVDESDKSCSCGKSKNCKCDIQADVKKVFVLGSIAIEPADLSSNVRLASEINSGVGKSGDIISFLRQNPWRVNDIVFVLLQKNRIPIYAIKPHGDFHVNAYETLLEFAQDQLKGDIERVAIGGLLHPSAKINLTSGIEIPVIIPDPGCMYSWTSKALLDAVCGKEPKKGEDLEVYQAKKETVSDFLNRVYNREILNLGISSEDRALNYSVTNIMTVVDVISDALEKDLRLDKIVVQPATVSFKNSVSMDVILKFNHIERRKLGREYQFTVELSGKCPVVLDDWISWAA